MRAWIITSFVALTIVSLPSRAHAAVFKPIGDLMGGDSRSEALAVSADGQTVVGVSASANSFREAFRWTRPEGIVPLGEIPGEAFGSEATGVSEDGSVIVGRDSVEAFRWTSQTEMVGIGDLPGGPFSSQAHAVSADGHVVVGSSQSDHGVAFRWTSSEGMVSLGDLPTGITSAVAFGVSGDGAVVVGIGHSLIGGEAFRWTEETGMVGLGHLPGFDSSSSANDITQDGNVVVGHGYGGDSAQAFRWTENEGLIGLGDLAGGIFDSRAFGVSADGSVIVGAAHSPVPGEEAFLWDAENGMRSLAEVLVDDFGLRDELSRWRLIKATGVSAQGNIIVGIGENPDGDAEGWFACLGSVAGDTDDDCDVDLTDLNNVRNQFGATRGDGSPIFGEAFPYDGIVDISDLNLVRNNFGYGASTVAIPEPSTYALSALVIATLLFHRGASFRTGNDGIRSRS